MSIIISVSLASCQREQWRKSTGAAWHTTYAITYLSPVALDDSIQAVLRLVEQSLSPFCQGSTVACINRGESDRADAWFAEVFRISDNVCARTRGMFDPTASPLINLWGFGYEPGDAEPTDSAICTALAAVGITDCELTADLRVRKKSPLTSFNFSAVAKGYGCDLMARMLHRNGCHDFMVEIGGEMALSGRNPKGRPWRVMIDAPAYDCLPGQRAAALVEATDCGVATSGNYRNYRVDASGRRVGHTISPITGRPAATDLLSATVVAPTAAEADAFATAFMALGSREAIAIAEADSSLHCLLILADSTLLSSSSFPLLQ